LSFNEGRFDLNPNLVFFQASTLGSLEALLEFLKSPDVNIPVSGINIGPVHKKDVMRASVMLERKRKEFACILAFDVKVTPEARDMAEELGVKVFTADIIYHLFDQVRAFTPHSELVMMLGVFVFSMLKLGVKVCAAGII
jgi:translation initiation factor 5B